MAWNQTVLPFWSRISGPLAYRLVAPVGVTKMSSPLRWDGAVRMVTGGGVVAAEAGAPTSAAGTGPRGMGGAGHVPVDDAGDLTNARHPTTNAIKLINLVLYWARGVYWWRGVYWRRG